MQTAVSWRLRLCHAMFQPAGIQPMTCCPLPSSIREAIESMTADRKNDLRKFELAEEEWVIAEEVHDTLKACDMVPRNDHAIS